MSREQKKLIEIPEGTLVEILKARRQSHLCSVRCVVADEETGQRALGSGRKAVDTCIAIPAEYLPKLKIEGVEPKAAKAKGGKKGTKATAAPVVAVEPEVAAGVGPADLQPAEVPAPAEQPAPAAVEAQAEQPAPAPVEAAV